MSSVHVILTLCGEAALLLWGIQMIGSAVQRGFGGGLRTLLLVGLKGRFRAFLAGLSVTALLQSSTATAMLATSFAAGGAVDLTAALAVMLGANVGTTLIVQAVSFDVSAVYPALILVGVVLHRRGRRAATRDGGAALVGLGLVLLSLHLLVATLKPLEASQGLREILHLLTGDAFLCLVLAALLSWAAHSSVAAMLFVMSLAEAGVISPAASIAMVLGANLGSALNPLAGALGGSPARLRVPVANLANRLIGCALVLPFVAPVAALLAPAGTSPALAAANFHLLFNLAAAALSIGTLPLQAAALRKLFPDQPRTADPGAPLHLDEADLETPTVALANATREVLRMAEAVESMLRGSRDAFRRSDAEAIAAIRRQDDVVDRLFRAIQRYLGAIRQEGLGETEGRRLADTLSLAINLEHVGDIVDRNLMDLAVRRLKHGLTFAPEERAALDDMHERLLDHLRLALAVFMSGDMAAARRLVAEKEKFRDLERAATERHVVRMRAGAQESLDASALQLDVTRDLKRIEAHIAATAYALLERQGGLRSTRLAS